MSDVRAIIIGSGFGGAVAALRLGEAGVDTVVLERGRRWKITDPTRDDTFSTFRHIDRRAEWMNPISKTPLYEGNPIGKYAGVLEVVVGPQLTLLVGTGVGGGSLAYGGILIQPPGKFFREAFPEGIDYAEMDRVYFPRVRSVIKTAPIPDDVLNSEYYAGLRVLCDHARKAGFEERTSSTDPRDGLVRFPMAVDWDIVRDEIAGRKVASVIAAEFWFGNNSGGKQTLDRDYLERAEETGNVKIRPLHDVTDIAQAPEGGYRVSCDNITEEGEVTQRVTLTCDHLFLAAGALGTTGLLMRARSRGGLPHVNQHLGEGFGNDGDMFVIRGELSEMTNPHLGGPGAIAVCNYENPIRPTIMMRAPFPRFATDYPKKDVLGSFVFTHNFNRGRYTYDAASDAVDLDFVPEPTDAADHLVDRLNRAAGGKLLSSGSRVTGHQLGGACMATVCDLEGRVAGHPHLYVVDGALLPGSSTCTNPAMTIAAIAERCMERIIATDLRSHLSTPGLPEKEPAP
ncbi:MAG TPA: GMC oxidoreductase [Mycobacterium sp.]|nr:GMC oxidoreductase [Mycobacterium sp.]